MTHQPGSTDRDWIAESVARVTAKYQARNPFTPDPGDPNRFVFDGPVPSHTNPDVTYHVHVDLEHASCTCKGYQYNHRCSHIRAVQEALRGK